MSASHPRPADPLRHARHFAEVVAHWRRVEPDALAFRFLTDGETEGPRLRYAELDDRARRIAGALRAHADPGARALLIYPAGLDFIAAFVACVYAGITAVPVYPPTPGQLETSLPRLAGIATNAAPSLVLASAAIADVLAPRVATSAIPALAAPRWLATDALGDEVTPVTELARDVEVPVALQYTSGSTGSPKGVVVTHASLLANERAIARAFGDLGDRGGHPAVGVGWLPTYHDMGLMGKVLQTLYTGITTTLMAPLSFIKRPAAWLRAISRYRGTSSGGPNFAYELCVRRIRDEDLDGVDLSSWRVAFCGAEPIRAASLDAFADRFAPWGFDRRALFPCYGLAEATLMVAGGGLGRGAQPRWLRAEALARHEILDAAPRTASAVLVSSCGRPVEGQDLRVVDPESRRELGPERIGELWVRGPSVAAGYFGAPEASADAFGARTLAGEGPFLRTGDLGFVRDGEVYVTGRRKELMLIRGRNIYPQDVEATVEACHRGIRPGGVAAFAARASLAEGERAVVVVELPRRLRAASERQGVEAAVREAVATNHGFALDQVVCVAPRTLAKTSSGKLQRAHVRDQFLAGAYSEPDLETDSASEMDMTSSLYTDPNDYFRRLEGRNTNYRFDLEQDVAWAQIDAPGQYFTASILAQSGVDLDATAAVEGLEGVHDTLQWALAVAICEEFVALEQRILSFLREERRAGRLPSSRSAELFDDEEVKHVDLFRRYADALLAQRPELAAELEGHLRRSFSTAWWHDTKVEDFPSPAIYHFVNWLHFVYFEEYSIYLHDTLRAEDRGQVQPAWLSAHAAHMREERQHVVTDAAHLERLRLSDEERLTWSRWFLERSSHDASGLAGLEGVWTFLSARYPALAELPQPSALLANELVRKRAFLRLLTRDNGFAQTLGATVGYPGFVADLDAAARVVHPAAGVDDTPTSGPELELRGALVAMVAEALGCAAANIDVDQPLMLFGLDSVAAVEIAGQLERHLGRTLPPTLLFEHPDIRGLARALTVVEPEGDEVEDPAGEVELDEAMFARAAQPRPQQLLLTGATGFLCSHLLAALLANGQDRVACLVRAASVERGRERLRDVFTRQGLDPALLDDRVDVVLGDLGLDGLGLTPAAFEALAARTDLIIHGGAVVDFIQPYTRLEAVNVHGTHELIRLAVLGGMIPFNLISTIGIFDTSAETGERVVGEDEVPDGAGFRNGYGRSKWAAERLVRAAGARGLPTRVFRPGVVSGSTVTGAWQPDMVAALLKSFVETGVAIEPTSDGSLDAAPVDYVAEAIVEIAKRPETVGGVFHLTNPNPTRWREVYTLLGELGHPVELAPYTTWLGALDGPKADGSLRPYLAYFKARDRAWKLRLPRFDQRNTAAALAESGLACPPLDRELLGRYLDHFTRTGFIHG